MAPGSQEGEFSSGEEAETPVQVSQNVSQPSVPVSLPPSEIGRSPTNSSKAHEAEDTPSSLKDLRDSVYTIMRAVNKLPFLSPPRPKRLTSTFEASCGMSQDTSKSHTSFPQSNHLLLFRSLMTGLWLMSPIFSSPDPKGHVGYRHHFSSVRQHFTI